MTDRCDDPWSRWYEAYRIDRAAFRMARQIAMDRRRTANIAASLLLLYMVLGGIFASIAVGFVIMN